MCRRLRRDVSPDRAATAAAPPAWPPAGPRRARVIGVTNAHHEEVGVLLVVSSDFASTSDSRSEAAKGERHYTLYFRLLTTISYYNVQAIYVPNTEVPYYRIRTGIGKYAISYIGEEISRNSLQSNCTGSGKMLIERRAISPAKEGVH